MRTTFFNSTQPAEKKPVFIISLGHLFLPEDIKTILRLAELTKHSTQEIYGWVTEAKEELQQFNEGRLSEEKFILTMLNLIKSHCKKESLASTSVKNVDIATDSTEAKKMISQLSSITDDSTAKPMELTSEQFKEAWLARYTKESTKNTKAILNEAKYEKYIYSSTNPWDEKHIIEMASAMGLITELDSQGHLKKLNGSPVEMSFLQKINENSEEKISKVSLFLKLARELKKNHYDDITLVLGSRDHETILSLKKEGEFINSQIKETTDVFNIKCIIVDPKKDWNLEEALKKTETITYRL